MKLFIKLRRLCRADFSSFRENIVSELSSYVESVVSPASKLERTILVIEWEPSDVNLTGGFEDAWNKELENCWWTEHCERLKKENRKGLKLHILL